jgi:diguanylate cyclase (GGDEF)-like protein
LSTDRGSSERDAHAVKRDARADERDLRAFSRSAAAHVLDQAAAKRAGAVGDPNPETKATLEDAEAARAHGAGDRERAAEDRERAAEDRKRAADDRAAAASDRAAMRVELEAARRDELTGAYRRQWGRNLLLGQIAQASKDGAPLVLAYVDIKGLKQTNDNAGHAAGDALLVGVTRALRSELPDDRPIVRWGGDEFVCAFTDTEIAEARANLDKVSELYASQISGATMRVGVAELRAGDTLEELMDRADKDLLGARD